MTVRFLCDDRRKIGRIVRGEVCFDVSLKRGEEETLGCTLACIFCVILGAYDMIGKQYFDVKFREPSHVSLLSNIFLRHERPSFY